MGAMRPILKYAEGYARIASLALATIFVAVSILLLLGASEGHEVRASAGSGFAGAAAVLFAVWQFAAQNALARSRYALDVAMDGVQRSYDVLTAERPTNNVAWVNGARLLLHAENMTREMHASEHLAAWELFKEEWRIKFCDLTSQPVEYYFGISESVGAKSDNLDYTDAFLKGSMERAAFEPTITMTNYRGSGWQDTMLSQRAIKVRRPEAPPCGPSSGSRVFSSLTGSLAGG